MNGAIILRESSNDYAMCCPTCGTMTQQRATSARDKRRRMAVLECATCGAAWTLETVLRVTRPGRAQDRKPAQPAAKCGTASGYVRHVQRREPPCPECRKANAAYQRQRRANSKQGAAA